MSNKWNRNIRWIGCALLLMLVAWGCECAEGPGCRTDQDCLATQTCVSERCQSKPATEPQQEPKVDAPGEMTKADEFASTDEAQSQEPVTEPAPEPRREPAPEPQVEPIQDTRSEPVAETLDGGVDAAPEPVPEGTGRGCLRPKDCPPTLFCVKGVCQGKAECTSSIDCPTKPFTSCLGGYCTIEQPSCKANGQCIVGTICHNGSCVPGLADGTCKINSDCPANFYCEKSRCVRQVTTPPVQCSKDSECRAWERCFLTRCMRKCTTPNDCPSISIPQCNAGICVNPNLPPGTCNADSDCLPRQYCTGNVCTTCKAKPTCISDNDCVTSLSNLACLNGECGLRCNRDTDCPTGGLNICSQGMCRGDGYNPVGCPEDTEICDLVITKVACIGGGRMTVTVQNVGIGSAVGRFYLCHQVQGPKTHCQGAIIMNYGSGGSVLRPRGTTSVTVSWRAKPGDIIAVDRPNIILEASEANNVHNVLMTCP